MIERLDIETIRAIPGGVELLIRAPASGEAGHREPYVVTYDWEAAQQIANQFAVLCAQEALRAHSNKA